MESSLRKTEYVGHTYHDHLHQIMINPSAAEENALDAILETRSAADDVPSGMRLHGARARLYTSVLAGAKTGDQL